MDTHGGTAGQKLADFKSEQIRPQPLGLIEGGPGGVQIPGRSQLGNIQRGQPHQLRKGQKFSFVSRHVIAGGAPGGILVQGVIKGGWHRITFKKAEGSSLPPKIYL